MIAPVDPYVAHVLASIEAAEASAKRQAELDRVAAWYRERRAATLAAAVGRELPRT